jgi:head-tail adaptor
MNSRDHDLNDLRQAWKNAKYSHERDNISRSAEKIRRETRLIESMRRDLIKAHREGNQENIKDVHSYIKGKQRYQNE